MFFPCLFSANPFFLLILFSFLVFLFIGNLVVLTSQHFPRFVLKILLSRISSLFLWWIVIWSLFIPFYTNLTLNTCLSDCLEAATMLYHVSWKKHIKHVKHMHGIISEVWTPKKTHKTHKTHGSVIVWKLQHCSVMSLEKKHIKHVKHMHGIISEV